MHGDSPGVEGSWVYGFINVWVHRFTVLGMILWALRVVKVGLFSNAIEGGPVLSAFTPAWLLRTFHQVGPNPTTALCYLISFEEVDRYIVVRVQCLQKIEECPDLHGLLLRNESHLITQRYDSHRRTAGSLP
jgi:hypothetical protein